MFSVDAQNRPLSQTYPTFALVVETSMFGVVDGFHDTEATAAATVNNQKVGKVIA